MTGNALSSGMDEVQEATGATDEEIRALADEMLAWAARHPNGRHWIEFGRFRNHGVSFEVVDGEIRDVQYGDALG